MSTSAVTDQRVLDALDTSLLSPRLTELMERVYLTVALGSPVRPHRSRVEVVLSDRDDGALAIDELLARGFLEEVDPLSADPRLALGEHRWPIRLPGERY
jgi:hypothetical protein